MPPQTTAAMLDLELLPGSFAVSQIGSDGKISQAILDRLQQPSDKFISITRTNDEISIVAEATNDDEEEEAEWRCIKIRGPMDFGLVGIMSDLTLPLKTAKISVFAISTWNTDYILVKKPEADNAVRVLREDGWNFTK